MELHQLLTDFRMESFELIESMEESLLHLEGTPGYRAAINELFRAISRLKESASLFGLDRVIVLACAMEVVLVRVDRNELPSNEILITLLLSCCTHMRTLIGQTSATWMGKVYLKCETKEDELLSLLNDLCQRSPNTYLLESAHSLSLNRSLMSPPYYYC
jgi:two-component system chemotaxis sensor kinase CheA